MNHILRLLVLAVAGSWAVAQISTPQVIKVQGFLNQSGSPANGTFTMGFTLYDAQFPGGAVVATASPQSVTVSNGLYEVDLPFAGSAFSGSSRYLGITVNGETLTPRMQMVSAPFAYQAEKLDGLEGADFVKKTGDTMTGNLNVAGTIYSTMGGFRFPDGTVQLTAASNSGSTLDQAYNSGGLGAGRTINANSGPVNVAGTDGLLVTGKVGIGTGNARTKLDVAGSTYVKDTLLIEASGPGATPILDFDSGFNNKIGVLFRGNGSGGNRSLAFRLDQGVSSRLSIAQSSFNPNPNLQTCAAAPGPGCWTDLFSFEPDNLQIQASGAGATPILDFNSGFNNKVGVLFRGNGSNGNRSMALRLDQGTTSTLTITQSGFNPNPNLQTEWIDLVTFRSTGQVGIGVANPSAALEVAGTTKTSVLQITGATGFDLAEPFQSAGGAVLPPGAVVVIDDEHPGKLSLADHAYDTRVAGVVSGAGGLDPGITIGQGDDAVNVAMAGRAYVLADATEGAIQPGDLLTSSYVQGHAMKARSRRKAHGAVIGKAMSTLESGQGLVLVLVNLQ